MIGLLQRVTEAHVDVGSERVAAIGAGLLVLACVERDDTEAQAERLAERIVGYRVFGDEAGRLNLSLADTGGGLLLVPQFTLAADTRKGMRPGLGRSAPPDRGRALFAHLAEAARRRHEKVECGCFGAHMQVGLVNDGPVTFWLEAHPG
ncbi:MAG TPA: D-aminoacyl-tRNA deacylase [Gammaproteobacteria bacterium]|nr:D-aminoacyl-tRNA deacylase [Gammaproteobacteria bacterium]